MGELWSWAVCAWTHPRKLSAQAFLGLLSHLCSRPLIQSVSWSASRLVSLAPPLQVDKVNSKRNVQYKITRFGGMRCSQGQYRKQQQGTLTVLLYPLWKVCQHLWWHSPSLSACEPPCFCRWQYHQSVQPKTWLLQSERKLQYQWLGISSRLAEWQSPTCRLQDHTCTHF